MIYDFLVISGGIAGVSAAYTLAAHGLVLLLEAENTTAYHATDRSAALFTRNYGGPTVRQVNAASADFFRTRPTGFCETPLLTPRGALSVTVPEDTGAPDGLLAMSEAGEEVLRIDPHDACAMVPFLRPERIGDAVYEANVTDIDVNALHLSYLNGAKARGTIVYTKQVVAALKPKGDVWKVSTATATFLVAKIINAAGAWADQIGKFAGASPISLVLKQRTAIIINGPECVDCAALFLKRHPSSGGTCTSKGFSGSPGKGAMA